MDVSRYANDNDQEYCYRGTAGDACCLQHYTLPGGCNEKKKNFVVTFFGRARTLSCPLLASANRNARTFRENGRLEGRRKGEGDREIGGSFRIHIVTVSAL